MARQRVAVRRAAGIYHVQRELQRAVSDAREVAVVLCDRGTLDGLAYWSGPEAAFWDAVHSTRERELRASSAVIHLRPPRDGAIDLVRADVPPCCRAHHIPELDARM